MRETQRKIIDALGVRPEIDPAAEVERRMRFLTDYLTTSNAKGYVLGISGGVDSTLAGFAFPGTEQAEFLDGLATGGHVEVVKTRDSAFFRTDLRAELDRLGVDHLLVCGVSTHSCVAQTAIDGFAENLHVGVARDAISSDNSALSKSLLEFLKDQMR